MSDVTPAVPEIWFKSQRVIRTVLASLIVLVPALNLSLPLVAEAFRVDGVPAEVYGVVNAVIGGCLVILAVVTRLMAIPAVNAFLTKIGAGSIPASAAKHIAE